MTEVMKSALSGRLIIPLVLLVFAIYAAYLNFQPALTNNLPPDNHLVLLANQFLHGDLALSPINLPRGDVAQFYDKRFLYFGPFPSLLLMPLIPFLGNTLPQQFLGPVFLGLSFGVVFFLARKKEFSQADSLWLAIFFTFSSVLLGAGIIPITAYQVQIIGTFFLLLALTSYFWHKNTFLVGLAIALAGLTRPTLYLAMVFFGFEFLWRRLNFRQLVLISLPVILSILLFAAYNHKRFRNPLETGYQYNMTHKSYPLSSNLRYGLSSLSYLPTNLYILLVKGPDPVLAPGGGYLLQFPFLKVDPWGLSLWFTSPLFLYLLFRFKFDSQSASLLLSSLIVAIPSLTFFSLGYLQYGYRYFLDFLPFLFVLLLHSLGKKLTPGQKFLIVLGVLFNALFLTSLWGKYPLLGIN